MIKLLKIANRFYNFIVGIMILILLLYSGYCIWDNNQIYNTAAKMWEIDKDKIMNTSDITYESRNVIAWINIDDTYIDYPIVQGNDNMEYLNKDIYGDYALSGSIFLDARNSKTFKDEYSIVYGHNMEKHMMFGDLKEFLDKDYFREHSKVSIEVKDGAGTEYTYQVLAVLKADQNQELLLNPESFNLEEICEYIRSNAVNYNNELLAVLQDDHIISTFVSLVTCSSGHTYEKIILIAVRTKIRQDDPEETTKPNEPITSEHNGNAPDTGDRGFTVWIMLLMLSAAGLITILKKEKRE